MNDQKHVVITGTSSGLGFALAQQLAASGYTVFAGVRKQADTDRFSHPRIYPVLCDVTQPEQLQQVYDQVERTSGGTGLFALINNAGINYISPFETADMVQERKLMDVNLFGAMDITRTMLPLMHRYTAGSRRRARIVNVGSIGGIFGLPWEATYHASKFAMLGWSQSLRYELDALQIDVSCFLPGGMKTEIFQKARNGGVREGQNGHPHSRYYASNRAHMHQVMHRFESGAASPGKAACAIQKILEKKKPPLKAYFGTDAFFIRTLTGLGLAGMLKSQFVVSTTEQRL